MFAISEQCSCHPVVKTTSRLNHVTIIMAVMRMYVYACTCVIIHISFRQLLNIMYINVIYSLVIISGVLQVVKTSTPVVSKAIFSHKLRLVTALATANNKTATLLTCCKFDYIICSLWSDRVRRLNCCFTLNDRLPVTPSFYSKTKRTEKALDLILMFYISSLLLTFHWKSVRCEWQ